MFTPGADIETCPPKVENGAICPMLSEAPTAITPDSAPG